MGWKNFSLELKNDKNKISNSLGKDLFLKAFLSNLCLRKSCYECAFKSLHRQGDITLADYWGVEGIHPEMDDDKGTSLILVNSKKGEILFNNIKKIIPAQISTGI